MNYKKISITSILLFFSLSTVALASDPLDKKMSLTIRSGQTFLSDSDMADNWHFDIDELSGGVTEIGIGFRLNESLRIETSLGTTAENKEYHKLQTEDDGMNIKLTRNYISPTLKLIKPVTGHLSFYGGLGLDLFRVKNKISYVNPTWNYEEKTSSKSENVFGFHCVGGLEYILYKDPQKDDFYDWPISFELQYKYTYASFSGADDHLVENIQTETAVSLPTNDMQIGGHTVTIGLKFYFDI